MNHPKRLFSLAPMVLLGITSAFFQEPVSDKEDLERIKQIQARHEKELMKLPAVLGVGIGSDHGRYVFQVLVDKTARKKPRLPAEIEGVPVKVFLTGPIVAQPAIQKGRSKKSSQCP